MKILVVEKPLQGPIEYPWTAETKKIFQLDSGNTSMLENGETIFIDDVGFSLEDEDN